MISKWFIKFFGVLAGLQLIFAFVVFLFIGRANPVVHAVFGMAIGLYLLWIILGGYLMYKNRDKIRGWVLKIPLHWALKFVIFSTALALLEEAVTTLMTNLAPWFGVTIGQAYITASANYWDVVLGHSVVIFFPVFVAWAYLLSKYDFKPNQAFLLFGLTGVIMEILYGGPQHILEIGMWMFVYGLMIYLPTYSLPERQVKPVRFYHYVLPFLLAIIFQAIMIPVNPLIKHFRPSVNNTFLPM